MYLPTHSQLWVMHWQQETVQLKTIKKYNQQPTFILHTPGGTLINLTPVPKRSTKNF